MVQTLCGKIIHGNVGENPQILVAVDQFCERPAAKTYFVIKQLQKK